MQVTIENLSNLERKLNVTVPAEHINERVKSQLTKIAANAKLPGFRPGKIPLAIVEKRYADSARTEVLENLIRDTYADAVRQKNLNPAGMPSITIVSAKPNEEFVYSATFEIYPEIKLKDLKELEVEKVASEVKDEDVEEMLEKMRKNHAKWQEVADAKRKSQKGDQLIIDFTVDAGEELKPKKEENVKFVLGDGFMWTEFEQPLYGVVAGEEKKYTLQIPATHSDKELADKKVEFVVKVHNVSEPILPELDDEFAKKMHIKEGGIAALKKEISTHMEKELQTLLQELFKKNVMDKLFQLHQVEVPKALVENELKRLAAGWQKRFSSSPNAPKKIPEFPRKDFEKQAERNVALGLLLTAVVKEHKVTVELEEIREKIEEFVSSYYGDKEKLVEQYLADDKTVREVESLLLEDKVITYLASQAKIIDKNISYKEAIAKR